MEEAHDDRFMVFVRIPGGPMDPPEEVELPVTSCASYQEACKIREAHRLKFRDCVIRFVGLSGGGD